MALSCFSVSHLQNCNTFSTGGVVSESTRFLHSFFFVFSVQDFETVKAYVKGMQEYNVSSSQTPVQTLFPEQGEQSVPISSSISSPLVSLPSQYCGTQHNLAPHNKVLLKHLNSVNVVFYSLVSDSITTVDAILCLHCCCMLHRPGG